MVSGGSFYVSGIIRLMPAWTGKTLGNVIIGELIARGGMAEVYFGSHTHLNRNVAVKIMRDHVEDDPTSRTRFEREARVVAGLNHNNIIQIFDYDLVEGRPCIVMELIPGASLANYLKALHNRDEKLPHTTIAALLKSIASAVDYAHEHHIVHRDIKPANILLRSRDGEIDLDAPLPEDTEPVLTDFGLVRLMDSSNFTTTGSVSGTPAYMSPEQARGDKVDHLTDIYSLGVVLYEMLAGTVPFDAESSFGVLMKHLNEPPPPIKGISKDMQAIIDRALSKESEHRYTSATKMVGEFLAVLEGKGLSTETAAANKAIKAAKPVNDSTKKTRTVFMLAGSIVLAALVLAGVWVFRKPPATVLLDPNQQVGSVSFKDFNYVLDEVVVNINNLPKPEAGTHYEVWLLTQSGEERRSAGQIDESGKSNYISPNSINLLSRFDVVEITIEPNNDSNPEKPDGEVVASSKFPPEAFNHVRHILVAIGSTPDGDALIQGLWWTANSVSTSIIDLENAFSEGDEETLRLKTEEVINEIVGNKNSELYKDWNNDGRVTNVYDGFGLLANGKDRGYIPQTILHAQYAVDAPDTTQPIAEHAAEVIICTENMQVWSEQLLALALLLQKMPFGPEMEEVISEMTITSQNLLSGVDVNANNRIEPVHGEGGADIAYEYALRMAEMPLLPGPNRIPPFVEKP